MAQLPAWTDDVSDHVMNAQVIAKEMVAADGVVTPNEQRLLDALYEAQERITEVDREISATLTILRSGKRPARFHQLRSVTGNEAA
jgi:hypothetical protein